MCKQLVSSLDKKKNLHSHVIRSLSDVQRAAFNIIESTMIESQVESLNRWLADLEGRAEDDNMHGWHACCHKTQSRFGSHGPRSPVVTNGSRDNMESSAVIS